MKIGVIGDDPAGPVLAKAWANAGRGDRRIGGAGRVYLGHRATDEPTSRWTVRRDVRARSLRRGVPHGTEQRRTQPTAAQGWKT